MEYKFYQISPPAWVPASEYDIIYFAPAKIWPATIGTMLAAVLLSLYGVRLLDLSRLERYTHALAGFAVTMCGVAVCFLGL